MPAESRLRVAPREPLNTALLEAIRHPTEVAAIERLHSRAGVQLASVFHDAEVARCAFRIPDRLKIRGRCRKYILHKAAEAFLPRHLAARPKGMIRITQDQRLWRVVDTIAAELLSPRAVAARGLLDPADVARLVRPPRRGRGRTEQFYRLWTLLLTELWCRTFIDARGEVCPLPLNPYARWPWRATGTTAGALSSPRPARAASS
jgi:asparagine synthase (glutamine-hydrolysing)